jgi:hypothetical protein
MKQATKKDGRSPFRGPEASLTPKQKLMRFGEAASEAGYPNFQKRLGLRFQFMPPQVTSTIGPAMPNHDRP